MNKKIIYQLDGRPSLTQAIPLGLQHILAMFVGNVTPLIIISNILNLDLQTKTSLIQCAMFVSGIVTLIQCYPVGPIGAKLPIVMGTSFGFVPAATAIGTKYGIQGILGACLVGAIFQMLVGGVVLKHIRKYFPPVVTGIVAIPMGKIDFSSLSQAPLLSVPVPFKLGFAFHIDAIIAMIFVYMVSTVETIGDITAITNSGLNREAKEKEIIGGVLADGLGSLMGAIFNVLPNTSFGQNVGIVSMTKIVNRFVVATGACILILAGIFPKVGALLSLMPSSVLGGASIVMFSMIVVSGIKLITTDKLTERNTMILAVSLGLGLGVAYVPGFFDSFPESIQLIFGESKTVLPAILAVILNIVLPKEEFISENIDLSDDLVKA